MRAHEPPGGGSPDAREQRRQQVGRKHEPSGHSDEWGGPATQEPYDHSDGRCGPSGAPAHRPQ